MEKSAQFKMLHLLFLCKLILLSDSSLEIICTLIVQVLGNKKKKWSILLSGHQFSIGWMCVQSYKLLCQCMSVLGRMDSVFLSSL